MRRMYDRETQPFEGWKWIEYLLFAAPSQWLFTALWRIKLIITFFRRWLQGISAPFIHLIAGLSISSLCTKMLPSSDLSIAFFFLATQLRENSWPHKLVLLSRPPTAKHDGKRCHDWHIKSPGQVTLRVLRVGHSGRSCLFNALF